MAAMLASPSLESGRRWMLEEALRSGLGGFASSVPCGWCVSQRLATVTKTPGSVNVRERFSRDFSPRTVGARPIRTGSR